VPSWLFLHRFDILRGYFEHSIAYVLAMDRYCPLKMSKSRKWAAGLRRCVLAMAGVALACSLASCSSVLSELPTQMGGLPEGSPERPANSPAYPAVHDMPPPRAGAVLTEAEKNQVEAELAAMRQEQARRAAERASVEP
jgi:hypothetical protein